MAITRDNISPTETVRSSDRRSINKNLDLLDKKMDEMYKDIYISRPDNKQNLDTMLDNMDEVIDKLQGSSIRASGMTELLKRVDSSNNTNASKLLTGVQDLFNDQTLVGSLFANDSIHKYIAGQNYNFDLICKYLPKLQDALEIKRDNVLSSDNFSKNFLNPKSFSSSKEESEIFKSNVKKLEDEYEVSDFLDKTYMNTSKYGEDFIYIVPYPVAFKRLLSIENRKTNGGRLSGVTVFEGYTEQVCLEENFCDTADFTQFCRFNNIEESVMKDIPEMGAINLHFNTKNVVRKPINEYTVIKDSKDAEIFRSVSESFYNEKEVISEAKGLNSMFDNVKKNNAKMGSKDISMDGLIVAKTSLDRDPDKIDKDFLGAVLERLPREDILPVYIGKKCVGYYYFEFAEDPNACGYCGGHHTLPTVGSGSSFSYNMTEQQQELIMRYISNRISSSIDTKFINSNKDLKEEIYTILNYNTKFDVTRTNNIGVTFIPAEDMVHCYFEIDEVTHRGISDLHRAVTPAMLYILLYLSDIIAKITRSSDKRIYYVKQNVETNVARTMMNVVQQIKKGNLGMRQIESMNNILNIVGKYNDFIIPVGQSGDSPVQFETMQGQNIETPTDLMEKMEESAINTIIPFEFVNSTYQTDYATRFSMSNTRFLKTVYTRQRKVEKIFSKIYTPLYNYEFGDNISKIEIILPPPTYLTATNNAQLIDNINQMAEKIIDADLIDCDDDVKAEFKRLYLRENLGTYIDFNTVERLRSLATVNVESRKLAKAEDGEDSDVNDMMNDDF